MKISRLDLIAFGPFTAKSLHFEGEASGAGAGLHLVFGANEAGKSSSLRALAQWLYGIPHASSDNFIHPHTDMRIGGAIATQSGDRFEFVRRKGRGATLRDANDGDTIDAALLEKLLAGVDAATFEQKFGISHEELRRGGAALVAGGGDVGESLFAAASGIAGLRAIHNRLDDEAAALFRPRGSTQAINKTLKQHKAACELIKKASLNAAAYDECANAYGEMDRRVAAIEAELQNARKERRRFERIEKSLPHIARLRELRTAHEAVAHIPLLPADFSRLRGVTASELAAAQRVEGAAQRAIEAIDADLKALNIEPDLLLNRSTIEALHKESDRHEKAAEDRHKLAAEAAECEKHIQRLLRDLGRDAATELGRWRLPKAARQRLQAIGGERQARIEKCESTGAAVKRMRDRISQLDSELNRLPAAIDASRLENALERARREGPLDKQLGDAKSRLARLEKQAKIELARLGLFSGPFAEIESLAVPAGETIDRFDAAVANASQLIERLDGAVKTATDELEKTLASIAGIHSQGEVPSEDQLREARKRRDDAWREIESRWLGEAHSKAPAPQAELAAAYRECVAVADEYADTLCREAIRVQQVAALNDLQRAQRERRDKLVAEKEAAQAAAEATWREWQATWAPLSIEPLPPREMRSWVMRQEKCAAKAAEIRQLHDEIEGLEDRIEKRLQSIRDSSTSIDGSQVANHTELESAIEAGRALLAKLDARNKARAKAESALADRREELRQLEIDDAEAARAFVAWQTQWKDAVALLNLSGDASFAEANAVIDKIAAVEAQFDLASALGARIRGIEDDAGDFTNRVKNLLSRIAPELCELPANESVGAVYDRLKATVNAEAKRVAWQEQSRLETVKRDDAAAAIKAKNEAIAAMCQLAGCNSLSELPYIEDLSNQRREIERDLRAEEEALREQAAGTPLDAWIAEASQQDADSLPGELRRLDESIENKEKEKTEAATAKGALGKELELMDGGSAAADARYEAELLLSQLRSDAEEYIRLKLASVVLRKSIERFRETSQGPALKRASEIFSRLTIGSFAGLRADYDDDGKAVLVGVRPDGKTVGVAGMSDGSCDQLFLALRLALLEAYLETREPMPFIVDDILIMFDEPRAVAALKALAELAKKTQVIFFTHHEHLVRLAQEHLPPESFSTHTLA